MVCPFLFPTAVMIYEFKNLPSYHKAGKFSISKTVIIISASTPLGTRESIYSIVNGAAHDTTVKNVTFTKARGESEMSRMEQFISLVELVNQKPWILIKS